MSLQPFRITIPTGPLTKAYVADAMQKALERREASEGKTGIRHPIRWAIVAETQGNWVIEGVAEG